MTCSKNSWGDLPECECDDECNDECNEECNEECYEEYYCTLPLHPHPLENIEYSAIYLGRITVGDQVSQFSYSISVLR